MIISIKMDKLLSKLPKELQDHISTYNVDHREMMSHVFRELIFWYQEIDCDNHCGFGVRRSEAICKNMYYTDYYYCCELTLRKGIRIFVRGPFHARSDW
jgi:inhibitor of KinA sporulation pathway (predicted exonuclease)